MDASLFLDPHTPSDRLGPWQGKAICLLDLDAFFASVEQLDHPEWRGKPVIVGGDASRRGVVATASYEARAFGVHSAMPAGQAEALCPQAIWTHGRFDRFRELSDAVMKIVVDETPYLQQVSIDEAFFDITPNRTNTEHPVDIARRIQSRVAKLGITCSIGLSTTKSISKIASNLDKPNGLTIVRPGCERKFIDPLWVRELSGVGTQTEKALHEINVYTIGELVRTTDFKLRAKLGLHGVKLKSRALGTEPTEIRPDEGVKSISHERTFAQDLNTRDEVVSAIGFLASMVARRLREHQVKAYTLALRVRYEYDSQKQVQHGLTHGITDEITLTKELVKMLDDVWAPGMPVRLMGVSTSDFVPRAEQITLDFGESDNEGDLKRVRHEDTYRKLAQATDALREKFGEHAVQFGSTLKVQGETSSTAPTTLQKRVIAHGLEPDKNLSPRERYHTRRSHGKSEE